MDIHLELDTSTDVTTAVHSVSLVAELNPPSLPSSVHIAPIIPSQSLILSKDKVINNIKDFGDDIDIFLLHLFQGDMDLPTLSFNALLEEQWAMEEGNEAVLKVLPPAYHQYFDVFSKVKAEKLPPQHACNHHIKQDGLLPPVVVIYSLSNHESEKLWA
ncbi:hypothetical protein O181_034423 [Austropuccinia psidii MF-1]|uniref:Uncharacterized protein n=1 Tax=Austropuccinia psidii MF-1 TaxID=1389203 RepID=A0A9Q3H7C1_9BASI|nr:hypothetical protein [Austropuccinia psidii MF-1]